METFQVPLEEMQEMHTDNVWWYNNSYMGVSLNGGTPKTPQNDHF